MGTIRGLRDALAGSTSSVGFACFPSSTHACGRVFSVFQTCDFLRSQIACGSPCMGSMRVVRDLRDALAGSTTSIGFTRRAGQGRTVHASLRQLLSAFPHAVPQVCMHPQRVQIMHTQIRS